MEKFGKFFEQIGLLNSEEFQIISAICKINVFRRTTDFVIEAQFSFDSIPDFNIIEIIEKNKRRIQGQLIISYFVSSTANGKTLNKYLTHFLDITKNNNLFIRSSFRDGNFEIIDGVIKFNYTNEVELNELTKLENDIVEFFQKFGIKLVSVELVKKDVVEIVNTFKQKTIVESSKKIATSNLVNKYSDTEKANYIPDKEKVTKIADIVVGEEQSIVIQGTIFKIEEPKRTKMPYTFYVSDYDGAIAVKVFTKTTQYSDLNEDYVKTLKIGQWVKIKARFNTDQYAKNEITGTAFKVHKISTPETFIRKDTATKPRIELMGHTKMSAYDGIASATEAIKRSISYNSPAIGFTDRGNVQGYPEIAKAAKENKQKILYGIEAKMMKKDIICVTNVPEQTLLLDEQEYIVFDLETTGLVNEFEEIIEFGGVKVKNGNIVDRFDTFIKPAKPIPQYISEMCHITNEMVENAPSFNKVIDNIITWIGNGVLVAHNGINFDIRFLNKKLIQSKRSPLRNVLIDTMQVSRGINKDMARHNLGAICRSNKILYDDSIAHRADFDAEVLNKVWFIFISKLKLMGIVSINDINSKIACTKLYASQFPSYAQIYAKNKIGLKQLYKLVSIGSTEQLYGELTIFDSQINENRNDLIIANNPYEGDIWDIACNGTREELEKAMEFYDYIFIAPVESIAHDVARNVINKENAQSIVRDIVSCAYAMGKPVCAVSGFFYLDKWDQKAHSVYIHNKLVGGRNHRFFRYDSNNSVSPLLYMRNTEEMTDELSFIDKNILNDIVIENTYKFASEIDGNIEILKKGLFTPEVEGSDQKFRDFVMNDMHSKYGKNPNSLIVKRIKRELDIIINKGYSVIYWISHLLIEKSIGDGYVVGSRGSVGSSLAAYFSTVSEVNPLPAHYICDKCKYHEFYEDSSVDGFDLPEKICPVCGMKMRSDGHNIPFETFLGTEGAEKVPDIDLNFSGEYQPIAHKFIHDMFGNMNAFRAGTILTVADKTAYGLVKNFYEITRPGYQPNDAEISWIAHKCVDGKRTTGQHAGGMIVVPTNYDLTDFCPYSFPPEGDEFGWYTTHFDFHAIHDNLLKFDILGHDFPTMLKMMKESSKCDPSNVDFQDKQVIKLFEGLEPLKITPDQLNGQTLGTYAIPECSTDFTIQMIKDSKPKNFGDLIRISGLSHGTEVWEGNAKQLIKARNLGLKDVVCCREDMLTYFESKGIEKALAFNISEAVRKGRGVSAENQQKLLTAGVPDWYIESCNKIKYLFPKAHATAYMLASYMCAWYKIYYPMDFYMAYFSIKPDVFDIETISGGAGKIVERLNDITTRMRDKILKTTVTTKEMSLVDIYKVALEMFARGFVIKNIDLDKSHAHKFIREGNNLIAPFNCVDGLGDTVAESIVKARGESPFTSREDLSKRTGINSKVMEKLIKMNIVSHLDESSQMSLNDFFE